MLYLKCAGNLTSCLILQGDTALHIALRKGSRDVVDFLREVPDCDKVESIKNKV